MAGRGRRDNTSRPASASLWCAARHRALTTVRWTGILGGVEPISLAVMTAKAGARTLDATVEALRSVLEGATDDGWYHNPDLEDAPP